MNKISTIQLFPYKDKHDIYLPKSAMHLILLNPPTMKMLQLKKGSYLLLYNSECVLLFKCWPYDLSTALLEPTAFLPAFNLLKHYTKLRFSVSLFQKIILDATRIVLQPDKFEPFMTSIEFTTFVKNEIGKLYLRRNMILNIKYLGCYIRLVITKIFSKDSDSEIKTFQNPFNSPNNSMLNIEFNDKCCISSTPIKFVKDFESSTPFSTPDYLSKHKSKVQKKLSSKRLVNNKVAEQFYSVISRTKIFIVDQIEDYKFNMTFEDIGGLNSEIEEIKSNIQGFFHSDATSRGILISGSTGTGKSMIVDAIRNEYKHQIDVQVVKKFSSKWNDNSGISYLKNLFTHATENSPSIIILDEIEYMFIQDNNLNNFQQNFSNALEFLYMVYNFLSSSSNTLLIATCLSLSLVHPKLRSSEVFGTEIKLPIPSSSQRKKILLKILKKFRSDISHTKLSEISNLIPQFTGGDILRLCTKAYSTCSARSEYSLEPKITYLDLKESVRFIKPSSIAEFTLEVPDVKWCDIGGMEEVKKAVKQMVDWPLKYPEKMKKFNISPHRGIMLYGPPGCCKTMIAKALANESKYNFITIKSSQIFNKYVGESENAVSEIFRKARSASPCILFFDEIDSLASVRNSGSSKVADLVVTQMLTEIDGVNVFQDGVSVLAATNRPDVIDPSFLRPGRFDRLIYVPLPDSRTREEIFHICLKEKPTSSDVDIHYLVEKTENYTGAEISEICRQACLNVIKENFHEKYPIISMMHLLQALMSVQPRTTREMIQIFESYHNKKGYKF